MASSVSPSLDDLLKRIKNGSMTEAEIIEPVRAGILSLYYVPHDLLTRDVCIAAVKTSVQEIIGVPPIFRDDATFIRDLTPENNEEKLSFFERLLDVDGLYLRHLSITDITLELCAHAVKNHPFAILYVPLEYSIGDVLDLIPEEAKDSRFYDWLVDADRQAWDFIPEEAKTEEVCRTYARTQHRVGMNGVRR